MKVVEKTRKMQSYTGEAERKGGLKGRDLSGLDCVLMEVMCIKWNLIGTDTGSLTDRHDADGLREREGERGRGGGRGGREKGREREREREGKRGRQTYQRKERERESPTYSTNQTVKKTNPGLPLGLLKRTT